MPTLPNTHALLIGIDDYQQVNRLPQQDLYAHWADPHLCAYPPKLDRGVSSICPY